MSADWLHREIKGLLEWVPPEGVAGYDPVYDETGNAVVGCVTSINGKHMNRPPMPGLELRIEACCAKMREAVNEGKARAELFSDGNRHYYTFRIGGDTRTFCPFCRAEFPFDCRDEEGNPV